MDAIEWAADVFGPEKFGAHLICGMGIPSGRLWRLRSKSATGVATMT